MEKKKERSTALRKKEVFADRPTDDLAAYLFHQGTNFKAYEYMGAHRTPNGFVFRVWAPNASAVYVVGDFNSWGRSTPCSRITDGGIWEAHIGKDGFGEGSRYKFLIENGGREIYKADPYAFAAETPPMTASVFVDTDGYHWNDAVWRRNRARRKANGFENAPLNIYEVHLASFMRGENDEYLTYSQLATELASYAKQMGYTHIEIMPVSEYPFDGSWGYQVCGYYAPTSRFGTPKDFMAFVDTLHQAGVGVIMDWVPAHFPKDAHGLYEFDGSLLYEYQGEDRMEHKGWGTRCFDVGRNEVQSFLVSNAAYWAEMFHIDGIRVDAVASMLYLDCDRAPGEWVPNVYGDNRCLEAIAFFQKLNGYMAEKYPAVMMIAEESTAFANVTSFDNGGLGFTMKWNMGWMNDSLSYLSEDPLFRKYHHNKLNFSLTYAFSEKYILPISHDEVVHGKKSLLDRAPVSYEDKFATDRAFMTYMMTHPGKKLLFMGSEIGQFREWDFASSIEWFLLDYPMHSRFQAFVAALNHFYLEHSELWELDSSWEGFEWMEPDDSSRSIISYARKNKKGETLVVCINFTPVCYPDYKLAVPGDGKLRCLFNSAEREYGGEEERRSDVICTEPFPYNRTGYCAEIDIPPYGAMIFRYRKKPEKKK